MAQFKNTISLFVLLALIAVALSQVHQGNAHNQRGQRLVQDRVRRQADQELEIPEDEVEDSNVKAGFGTIGWTSCDYNVIPRISCESCYVKKICKPVGGLLKQCAGSKPFCNAGICSALPSAECVLQA